MHRPTDGKARTTNGVWTVAVGKPGGLGLGRTCGWHSAFALTLNQALGLDLL